MTRPTIQIVMFLMLLNAAAAAITASGVGAALDMNPDVAHDQAVDDVQDESESVNPSQGRTDTLFSMFTSTASTIASIGSIVFYGPLMLRNLGIPQFITTFLFVGSSVIVAVDVIHALSGRF